VPSSVQDILRWRPATNGKCTSKSTYTYLNNNSITPFIQLVPKPSLYTLKQSSTKSGRGKLSLLLSKLLFAGAFLDKL
jgi:hypothetical protein